MSNASTVLRGPGNSIGGHARCSSNSAHTVSLLKDIVMHNEPDLRDHLKHDYVFCVGDFVLRDEDTFFTARKLTEERPPIDIESVL